MSNISDDGRSSTFGRSLMSYISSKLPYSNSGSLVSPTEDVNPKYKYFEQIGTHRAEALSRHSISQSTDYNMSTASDIFSDDRFSKIMYANIQKDKGARIRDYRVMAAFAEVADALDEICDECINPDDKGDIVHLQIKDIDIKDADNEVIEKEFKRYVQYFDLDHAGWGYFRSILTEGEIYWEHIIHQQHVNEGILGVVQVSTDLIDPVFGNIQNNLVKGFLYRKPKFDPNNPLKQTGTDFVPMDKNQVTYINSGIWNENKTMRLPFIENARRAYRQLSLIEDSIVIYRLVRAPERLVFDVDVGNMPAPKAEAYLKKLIQNYWSSKTFDLSQNSVQQKFNPQSMLDAFWFARRTGSEGTKVTQLPGGANLGELTDLQHFQKKLFKALKVPTSRLDPEDAFRDGQEILREELKFAKFIIRLQQHFAKGLKNGFIAHLQLKSLWKELDLKEQNININFNVPTNFYELRENQKLELKLNNFTSISNSPSVSPTFAQKKYLNWNDRDILANREFLRQDKAFQWELMQIETNGKDWKEMLNAAGGQQPAESPEMGGGAGGGVPPSFGGAGATNTDDQNNTEDETPFIEPVNNTDTPSNQINT